MAIKFELNAEGRFYVDSHCINCSLCAQIAPEIFATQHEEGYEYVQKQPGSREEMERVAELIEICPADAIKDNG